MRFLRVVIQGADSAVWPKASYLTSIFLRVRVHTCVCVVFVFVLFLFLLCRLVTYYLGTFVLLLPLVLLFVEIGLRQPFF